MNRNVDLKNRRRDTLIPNLDSTNIKHDDTSVYAALHNKADLINGKVPSNQVDLPDITSNDVMHGTRTQASINNELESTVDSHVKNSNIHTSLQEKQMLNNKIAALQKELNDLKSFADTIENTYQEKGSYITQTKTINGQSVVGAGNIAIPVVNPGDISTTQLKDASRLNNIENKLNDKLEDEDIATINGQKITEGGNIIIKGGEGDAKQISDLSDGDRVANLEEEVGDLESAVDEVHGEVFHDDGTSKLDEKLSVEQSGNVVNFVASPSNPDSFYTKAQADTTFAKKEELATLEQEVGNFPTTYQKKLKAGANINIAEDGTISAVGGGSGSTNLYSERGQQTDGAPTNKLLDDELTTFEKQIDEMFKEVSEEVNIEGCERHQGYIYQGAWRTTSANYQHIVIGLEKGYKVTISADGRSLNLAILAEYNPIHSSAVVFAEGYPQGFSLNKNEEITLEIYDTSYLVVQVLSSGVNVEPKSIHLYKESIIKKEIESNAYVKSIDDLSKNNSLEIDKLKTTASGGIDDNFPINPQILDTDSITIKSWNANEAGAEVVDGVRGEDFNTTSRVTFNEACNVNLEDWDAFEVVFKVTNPTNSSVVVKLQNGNTDIFNYNLGTYIKKCHYSNQLYRYRKSLKDIDNYEDISHFVNNVQLIFISSDITNTCTMYGIKFVKIKPYVCISFDGSWEGVVNLALPVMSKYGIKGVTYTEVQYMTGEKDDGRHMTPEQVRQLDNNGWDVSNHSWHHKRWAPEDVENTDEMCEEDMKFARNWMLQNGFARGANFYAAPHGVTNEDRSHIFDKYMKYYRAGGSSDYDGYVFPCGLWLTANGRCNIIPYITFGGSPITTVETIMERVNRGIAKGKSININFHNIVADKAEGETYGEEQYPIGEFTKFIAALAVLRDEGKCYVLPNSVVWYGCHGSEIYDNISGHAEMIGMNGKKISLDANKF